MSEHDTSEQTCRVAIATCRQWPDLSVSDSELASELSRRGHSVVAQPWNAAPLGAFTSSDIVVLRSNWDFHHELDRFDDWLSAVDASNAELHNPAGLVREYNDKSYLERVRTAGIPTPRTLQLPDFDPGAVADWMNIHNYEHAVVKPAWGASGHLVERVGQAELQGAASRWRAESDGRPVLVQQFIPAIADGEHALVFFAGEFSHALLRMPAGDDFRVNTQYGGTMQLAPSVEQATVDFAAQALAHLPVQPTYARVDVVGDGSTPMLMEFEVNEPALGLHLAPGAAERFADALLAGPSA